VSHCFPENWCQLIVFKLLLLSQWNVIYFHVKIFLLFLAWPLAWTDSLEWSTIIWDVSRLHLKVLRCTLPVQGVGLRPLACWGSGFELHRRHGRLSRVSAVSLRRAAHLSRGVLPTVVRRCVWSRNLVNEQALAHWGAVAPKTNRQTNKDAL